MKKVHSINLQFILSTFLIMACSSLLSGFILFLLMKLEMIDSLFGYPVIRLILILLSNLVIGGIISIIVTKKILSPINQLVRGTEEISRGNFDIQVIHHQLDNELGLLIDSFNTMAKELRNVDYVHSDFINNFSHELKTPIASIIGFTKQLKDPSLSETEKEEYRSIILEEAQRLNNLSSNILLVSKLENQEQLTLKKRNYSLDEQLRTCIVLLQNEWEKKKIDFLLELTEVTIFADEELLTQLWLNLIKNAITYTPEYGKITVSCYTFGSQIKVLIKDTGIGMDDYTRERVFDKFYQGDASRHTHGNGLGLTISQRIVKLHKGKITSKSKLKEGSTFILIFPKEQLKDEKYI